MNFFSSYLEYNKGNEVNPAYHLWTAHSVLSSCVSRHVWLDLGYFTIYPNLYVVLLGPAGNGKSTALSSGYRMCEQIGNIPLSADCQSPEDMVKMLARDEAQQAFVGPDGPVIYTHLSLFVQELSNLIMIDPEKMLDFFVTIYDRDERYTRRTLKHGEQVITRPCVCLAACTVPDWISKYLKTDIITGGFTRRTCFVMEDYSDRRVPFPLVTQEQHCEWDKCVAWGKQLQALAGPFHMEEAAKKWWETWYTKRSIVKDQNVSSFDKTRPTLVLKLAILRHLSTSLELVLLKDDLELALELTDTLMKRLPDVFGCLGRNELAQVGQKLLSYLNKVGGAAPEKELLGLLWKDATPAETMTIIQQLINQNQLVRIPAVPGKIARTMLALNTQQL